MEMHSQECWLPADNGACVAAMTLKSQKARPKFFQDFQSSNQHGTVVKSPFLKKNVRFTGTVSGPAGWFTLTQLANLPTYNLSTHNLFTHIHFVYTQVVHRRVTHIDDIFTLTHTQLTHTHTHDLLTHNLSNTICSHTHNFFRRKLLNLVRQCHDHD